MKLVHTATGQSYHFMEYAEKTVCGRDISFTIRDVLPNDLKSTNLCKRCLKLSQKED